MTAQTLPGTVIPDEMAEQVHRVLAGEPATLERHEPYRAVVPDQPPFTLRALARPAWRGMVLALVLVAAETGLAQVAPLLTQRIIDDGVIGRDERALVVSGLVLVAATLLGAVVTRSRMRFTGRLGQRLTQGLRLRLFAHLQRLSLEHFTHERSGRILTRLTSDVEALTGLLQDGIVNLLVQVLTLVFVVVVLFAMNVELAAMVVVTIVPAVTWATVRFRRTSTIAYDRVRERLADVVTDVQENVSGIRAVIAANRQPRNTMLHRRIVTDYARAGETGVVVSGIFSGQTELLFAAAQILVLAVGGLMVRHGSLTVGELTAFLLYVASFFGPIQTLVNLYSGFQAGQAAVGKLRRFLGAEPTVRQSPTAQDVPLADGRLRFHDVSFGYSPTVEVLHRVTLEVEPGETLALVGRTGAGKSTLAKLIPRFYDPTHGQVLLDDIDVRCMTFSSLRRQVGVVPQEPFLFQGTLRDNIAFGAPDVSDEEIEAECRELGLGELLARLPRGIHTEIAERGGSLSAGERQLVCLARTSILRPRILVLDEATSNLDQRAERMVNAALARLLRTQTSVIVAHRLTTALSADRIAVVDDGRIVEHGTPDELLAAGGPFAQSYATWAATSA